MTTKKSNLTPEIILKAHTSVRAKGQRSRNAVVTVLKLSDQPLIATEVQTLLASRGVSMDKSHVALLLKQLAASKQISTRTETLSERVIRFGRHEGRGAHIAALYYWAPTGKVPARTKPSNERPARQAIVQTGTEITAGTNNSMSSRIAELEAQVAEMRKIIGV